MPNSVAGTTLLVYETSNTGLIIFATINSGTIPTTADLYLPGATVLDLSTGTLYKNTGTTASPSFNNVDEISTSEIADGAITAAKVAETQSVTATADGLTTGLVTTPTSLKTFVAVTSGNAAHIVTLPAISASTIGQEILLTVGANGYEIRTPATSNNTINQVDADGTNELAVAANTTVRCTQVSSTGWLAETIAAATIAITAPDAA